MQKIGQEQQHLNKKNYNHNQNKRNKINVSNNKNEPIQEQIFQKASLLLNTTGIKFGKPKQYHKSLSLTSPQMKPSQNMISEIKNISDVSMHQLNNQKYNFGSKKKLYNEVQNENNNKSVHTTNGSKLVVQNETKSSLHVTYLNGSDVCFTSRSPSESGSPNSTKSLMNQFRRNSETSPITSHISCGNVANKDYNLQVNDTVYGQNKNVIQDGANTTKKCDNTNHKYSKDKTPMCLVNELARFNKIIHQYRLTNEKGPAHCKRFTVTLQLGDEEYSAEGFKIKKAQHMAAAQAIERTKYKHPVPKLLRRSAQAVGFRANITPTMELNALAMKLGQQTYYLFDPNDFTDGTTQIHDARILPSHYVTSRRSMLPHPSYLRHNSGGSFQSSESSPLQTHVQRYFPPKFLPRYPSILPLGAPLTPQNNCTIPIIQQTPPLLAQHHMHGMGFESLPLTSCRITLIVGKQKFIGKGRTVQQAKHDAASRALEVLREKSDAQIHEVLHQSLEENDKKSPISKVHEIAIKRNKSVCFKIVREEGPAHMKNFITACFVGTLVSEGEGNGKKISKKRAAEKMLEELRKLPPVTPTKSSIRRIKIKTPGKSSEIQKCKSITIEGTGLHKRQTTSSNISLSEMEATNDNPITKLVKLQHIRKEKQPVFEVIAKNTNESSRHREFIVEVMAQGMVARGSSNKKKMANKIAAENLLQLINETSSLTSEDETNTNSLNIKPKENVAAAGDDVKMPVLPSASLNYKSTIMSKSSELNKQVTHENNQVPFISTSAGNVPGILILRQSKKNTGKKKEASNECFSNENSSCTIFFENNRDNSNSSASVEEGSNLKAHKYEKRNKNEDALQLKDANITKLKEENELLDESSLGAGKMHMKEHLMYLAKITGFAVSFNDYPKRGSQNEFLTIVTMSSDPPQICHGTGSTCEESQNDAASNALKILSELGLNSAQNKGNIC